MNTKGPQQYDFKVIKMISKSTLQSQWSVITVALRQARMPSWWEFVMAVLNDGLLDDHWRPMVDLCSVRDVLIDQNRIMWEFF